MQVGPYKLPNSLILAPMAGVTDRPFRQLCKKHGAGMAVAEMTSANPALWGTAKSLLRTDHSGETEPRVVQIAGADPQMMAEAAQYNVERGAQIIDINMGCPAKKVCNRHAGSALLSDTDLVREILDATVQAVNVPVTLKIRTGIDRDSNNALLVAQHAQDSGIQSLAVHGRSRACAYKGEVEYDTVKQIKSLISIPVIANGDIQTPEQAKRVLKYTGADGIMIGRAAQGRPWIFNEINHYLETGEHLAAPSDQAIGALLQEHVADLHSFYGDLSGLRIARKHIGWYLKSLSADKQTAARSFRNQLMTVENARSQLELIEQWFATVSSQIEQQAA